MKFRDNSGNHETNNGEKIILILERDENSPPKNKLKMTKERDLATGRNCKAHHRRITL